MSTHKTKTVIAKDRIDLPYTPGKIFCRAFFYFKEELLMVTGSEEDILYFSEKHLADKIYLMTLHKCPKYKETNKDNLTIFHMPSHITDMGIAIALLKKKDYDNLKERVFSDKINDNHQYRFVSTCVLKKHGREAQYKKQLLATFKRLPRKVPETIVEWLRTRAIFTNNPILEQALSYPDTLPTEEELDLINEEDEFRELCLEVFD